MGKKSESEFTGVFVMVALSIVAYVLYVVMFTDEKIAEKTKDNKATTAGVFLSSMIGPLIFGFLDNYGMMVGTDALEGLLPKKTPNTVKSMAGNTFSDAIGAFMGYSISSMIKIATAYDEERDLEQWRRPLYELIGIVVGCLVPIAFYYAKENKDVLARIVRDVFIVISFVLLVYLFLYYYDMTSVAYFPDNLFSEPVYGLGDDEE